MSTNIRIDYDAVLAAANRISNIATISEQASYALKNATSHLHSEWRGHAKNSFDQACSEWMRDINQLTSEIRHIGDSLRAIAYDYKARDERLAKLAEQTYNSRGSY
ncbi:MAG: WXG100 family type VII secretion target [Clostridia bacterium]|nr:WXG100 family type VII secretion target [Clostridia bacterium]